MKRLALFSWLAFGLLAAIPSSALAYNLNVFAGTHLHANEYGLVAAELTMPMIAEVGPFFEWSRGTSVLPENRYIAGLVGRVTTPWLNFFVDVRAGYDWNSVAGTAGGQDGFQIEPGLGYRFAGSTVDLLPRVGFAALRANGDIPRVSASIGVAIVL